MGRGRRPCWSLPPGLDRLSLLAVPLPFPCRRRAALGARIGAADYGGRRISEHGHSDMVILFMTVTSSGSGIRGLETRSSEDREGV